MNMPGFTGEASLHRPTLQYWSSANAGQVNRGSEVVLQMPRSQAQAIVDTLGIGQVRCFYTCSSWGSCGYEYHLPKRCCYSWSEDCGWQPW